MLGYQSRRAELEGEVDFYVEHLTVDELRIEFRRETEEMQPKRKGAVLEEMDEDLANAIPENNSSAHYLTDHSLSMGREVEL
ncbi:hypothetical protein GH714_036655 [Hevea brasiliensis]|uniref:Uncharacterized protein n=1 Tax=Hevea brasiliensis TaxID=3981 RepID=A0A6A6M6I3_HEVBR|nr:hypothetical protein GH714_036655 [Hevea brasiliensis]